MYLLDGSVLKIPLYIHTSCYFTLIISSVTAYTRAIFFRLETVTHILARIMNRSKADDVVLVKALEGKDEAEIIAALSGIYQDVIEICDDINICHGLKLMLGFGLVYFYTLFTSFTVYTDFVNVGSLTDVSLSALGFCIYYNIVLASVIFSCIELNSEVIAKL